MPHFQLISSAAQIPTGSGWIDCPTFKSKNKIVDRWGKASSPKEVWQRDYRIISKQEYHYSLFQRLNRGFWGILAITCTLGLAIFSKDVRSFVTQSKKVRRFAIIDDNTRTLNVNGTLQYYMPEHLFNPVRLDDKRYLSFIIINKNGEQKLAPAVTSDWIHFSLYEGTAKEAVLKIAQAKFVNEKDDNPISKIANHPLNNFLTKETIFDSFYEDHKNGNTNLKSLNKAGREFFISHLQDKIDALPPSLKKDQARAFLDKIKPVSKQQDEEIKVIEHLFIPYLKFIGASFFKFIGASVVGDAGPRILIHESGHYAAALALYKNANPSMEITPFQGGGVTMKALAELSWLGDIVGRQASNSIFHAGGMIATTSFGSASLILAQRIKTSYPKTSDFLKWLSIAKIANEVVYGCTTFITSSEHKSHDFMHLWRGGIHPLVPISMIVTIPLICHVWASRYYNRKK